MQKKVIFLSLLTLIASSCCGQKNQKQKNMLEVYTEKELKVIDLHINNSFGECKNVFHEIASPDIHVDICVIEPTKERNHYTLVTMGMGAHKMNIPTEFKSNKIDRAELVVTLPPDWDLTNFDEEINYWPIRWLKLWQGFL